MNNYDEAKVITHDEVRKELRDKVIFSTIPITMNYLNQQEKKDERAKKVEELLEVYKGIDGGGSPEGLNKLYKLRDNLEKELEEMK